MNNITNLSVNSHKKFLICLDTTKHIALLAMNFQRKKHHYLFFIHKQYLSCKDVLRSVNIKKSIDKWWTLMTFKNHVNLRNHCCNHHSHKYYFSVDLKLSDLLGTNFLFWGLDGIWGWLSGTSAVVGYHSRLLAVRDGFRVRVRFAERLGSTYSTEKKEQHKIHSHKYCKIHNCTMMSVLFLLFVILV